MKIVQCNNHQVSFRLPTLDEEFISGSLHEDVERIWTHILENIDCEIEEVSDGKRIVEGFNKFVKD